jgi:hypothetical protein
MGREGQIDREREMVRGMEGGSDSSCVCLCVRERECVFVCARV